MKLLNYAVLRNLCALIVGFLLIIYPNEMPKYLIILIGALFFIPGLFILATSKLNEAKSPFSSSVSCIGSILFGLWLMIMPSFFLRILVYVLGAILVLAGINQLSRITELKQYTKVPIGFYVFPILILLAGLVVLANPFSAVKISNIILGVSAIVYAITDLLRIIKFRKYIEQIEKSVVDADAEEVFDELPSSDAEEDKP